MMTVINRVPNAGYPTILDLNPGDLFVFLGETDVYLLTGYDDLYVRLPDGEVFDAYESNSKPVKTVKAELIVTP